MSLSIKFPVSALASISQTFLYCLSGELITNKCLKLGDEAYDINWEEKKSKQITFGIQMIIMRSQRAMKITVGGVMELSLSNFITVSANFPLSFSSPKKGEKYPSCEI